MKNDYIAILNKMVKVRSFFIQKVIGWVLREYSKTNPTSVKRFIETHSLSASSVREGSEYLK